MSEKKPESGSDGSSEGGQVSEVSSMADAGEEIYPGDATAGHPDTAGHDRPEEGAAGPDATPREQADAPDAPGRDSRAERGSDGQAG